jgi:hypothetical protein
LDLLHCDGAYQPKNTPESTPPCIASWIPDWTCKPRFSSFLKVKKLETGGRGYFFDIKTDYGYESSSRYTNYADSSLRGHALVVRGFVADSIQDLQSRDIVSRPTLENYRKFLD